MPLDREMILDAARQCYDPEIPINIVDLGLIYDVQCDDAGLPFVAGDSGATARARGGDRRSARRESGNRVGTGVESQHDQPWRAPGSGSGSLSV